MITSLFAGFNNAVRAMQTAQYALTIHSSNIAHANDPSYTRRDLLPTWETQLNGPAVARLRDAFIDDQYRHAMASLGEGEVRRNVMAKVEDIFGDPVDGGLRKAIDQFFDSWQGLADAPSDPVARLQVLSGGQMFAQQIKWTYERLNQVEQTVNEELVSRTEQVNTLLGQVFDLNKRIAQLSRNKLEDADLRDQRDHVLDQLAKLVGATSIDNGDGTVRVVVGSVTVVDGPTVTKLALGENADGQPTVYWHGFASFPFAGKGTIGGLLAVRDVEIKQLKSDIDQLGRAVAARVNAQHAMGYPQGGGEPPPFFIISGAKADIVVNPELLAAPNKIAAAGDPDGLQSDGNNARALAALAELSNLDPVKYPHLDPELNPDLRLTSTIIPGQAQSPRMFYRNLVGWIGSRAQDANLLEEISLVHVRINEQQRQSEWGVSMDEEVAGLALQQKAFAAAARVINAMDQMLDDLINRTGR